MTYNPTLTLPPKDYKQADDLYHEAVAIAEHIRGDKLLPGERSALYYGIIKSLDREHTEHNWGTEWELVAQAAIKAMSGYIMKDGELVKEYKGLRKGTA